MTRDKAADSVREAQEDSEKAVPAAKRKTKGKIQSEYPERSKLENKRSEIIAIIS